MKRTKDLRDYQLSIEFNVSFIYLFISVLLVKTCNTFKVLVEIPNNYILRNYSRSIHIRRRPFSLNVIFDHIFLCRIFRSTKKVGLPTLCRIRQVVKPPRSVQNISI